MAEEHAGASDMIQARLDLLPNLSATEQKGLFTFSKLVAPSKLPCTLFTNILHDLFDHISVIWGCLIGLG